MRNRTTGSTGDRRRPTARLGRRVAALLGVLVIALLATPQAQAIPVPPGDSGSYTRVLRNTWTGKCVDLPNYGSVAPNTPVSQFDCNWTANDNQIWNIVPTRTVNGTQLYKFVNVKSNLCLDLPNYGSNPAGTRVSVYGCASNQALDNQEWFVSEKWDASGTFLGSTIVNWQSDLCLDVSGSARDGSDNAENLPLTLYYCSVSGPNDNWDDHLWSFDPPA